MSGYIIEHKTEYYTKLLKVTTDNAWTDWILYFLTVITETSKWTTRKILAIHDLIKASYDEIKAKAPAIYSKELVELLFIQPYVRIQNIVELGIAERQTASKYLKTLCDIGFLVEVSKGRDKLFVNHQFLVLLKEKVF